MKKLNLSIPSPCHENWDEMTQEEKGKFCGACQKTVVDFTSMSDRQLVDFFKKPKADVCGRFNNDQLEREILMPRKRISWIRYFFQFTWPALMLGLKSCNNATTGKVKGASEIQPSPNEIKLNSTEFDTIQFRTLGFAIPEIIPYETPEKIKCKSEEISAFPVEKIDSLPIKEDTIISSAPLDTVKIITYAMMGKTMGLFSTVTSIKNVHADATINLKKESSDEKFLAYPNPVHAGSMLTITFPENNIPEKIQLISVSGQIITSIEQDISAYATMCNIRIPSHVSSGIYFLRLISKNKILNTSKIVVNK